MKVLLVTLNSKYSHINIALYYLKNCIKDICDVTIKNYTINDSLDNLLEDIMKQNADLICFGCYIWNIEQTVKLAKNINTLNKNITIAFGGPEVSYNPHEVLKKYTFVSSIMCGEGEISIKNLIIDIKNNKIRKLHKLIKESKKLDSKSKDIVNTLIKFLLEFIKEESSSLISSKIPNLKH